MMGMWHVGGSRETMRLYEIERGIKAALGSYDTHEDIYL